MTDMVTMDALQDDGVFGPGRRLNAADPIYGEIVNFLTDEAMLLDSDRYEAWLTLLADDISYRMPSRSTLYRRDGTGFDRDGNYFNDDKMMLAMRVKRNIGINSAYDRDPAPRMRRMISNIAVRESQEPGEYAVSSAILFMRNRLDDPHLDILAGSREDVVRRNGDGWLLAKRVVLLDQSVLANLFLNVFL